MKSFSCKVFLALFFFSAVAVSGINAQLPPNGVEFKAPFPFTIGTSNLPAGNYTVKPSQDDLDVLTVTDPSGHTILTFCDEIDLNSVSGQTQVTFRKYGTGTEHFLKQITVGGSSQGCAFAASDTEKKAKKSGSPSKDVVAGNAK